MKIGVLTFHAAYNYGAMLQSYALFSYLTNKGYDVEYLDYRTEKMLTQYRLLSRPNSLKSILRNIVVLLTTYKTDKRRQEKFEQFLKRNIRLSRRISSADELSQASCDYDVMVCGSDQIWNTELSISDEAYFLGFSDGHKIAYAPSFGTCNKISDKEIEWISGFNALSVREESGRKFLNKSLGQNVPIVVDPVFLLNKEQWYKFVPEKSLVEGEYIYFYTVGERHKSIETTQLIARKLGLRVVVSQSCGYTAPYPKDWIRIYDSGPLEFLQLIKNAKLVVGSSFHCAAFSIVFNQPFYTLNPTDPRISNLLTTFGIVGRGIDVNKFDIANFSPNYEAEACDYEHSQLVCDSKKFLDNALTKVECL